MIHAVRARHSPRSLLIVVLAAALAAYALGAAPAARAAATSATVGPPATVSADALPTVQIGGSRTGGGVVWAQVVVGDTVYVTGDFETARPAGAPPGTGEVRRHNLLAYDIRTGALLAFQHDLNGPGLSIAAAPDGSRVYVGGDFTSVDGASRSRVAAFDTASGALVTSFKPVINNRVRAVAVSAQTVYLGGDFTSANGLARARLAAYFPNGQVLVWNPGADAAVLALTMSPDASMVVAGGRFQTLAGATRTGIGAVSAKTAAVTPWASAFPIHDYGPDAAITSLVSDRTAVYGTGYRYLDWNADHTVRLGNFEGRFAMDPATGKLLMSADCRGDSYSTFPVGKVLYSVSHSHDCSNIGTFPDTKPPRMRRALAELTSPGDLRTPSGTFATTATTQLTWYPILSPGAFTGQFQAAWSVNGNADYLSLAGEFPTVNGMPQQGLVRFAVRSIAPNQQGPAAMTGQQPTATSGAGGTATVRWTGTSDPDDGVLTYQVYREGAADPVASVRADSPFWAPPALSTAVTGLAPGDYRFRVAALDSAGNTTTTMWSAPVSVGEPAPSTAALSAACTGQACIFSGSRSPVGPGVATYAWSFGDGTTGSGASLRHTYAAVGTYRVTLTVTEGDGRTATATRSVTVKAAAPGTTLAGDLFQRRVTGGFGTPGTGGPWSATGTATYLSVSPGKGSIRLPSAGATTGAVLGYVASARTDVSTTVAANRVATGGGTWVSVIGRRVGKAEYRAVVHLRSDRKVGVSLARLDATGKATTLKAERVLPGVAFGATTRLRVRMQVFGTSSAVVRAKVWRYGSSEPTAWSASTTDGTTALRAAGSVGIRASLSSTASRLAVVVTLSSFVAKAL